MLNIPESIKSLFSSDRCRKNFRVRFPNGELPDITNKDVVRESVRFTESLCSRDILKFGLTEASVIEFETVGVGNMYGMMIEAFCEVDTSSLSSAEISSIQSGTWDGVLVTEADSDIGYGFYRIPYGLFRVESCPRNHEAMAHRQVKAYSLSYSRLSRDFEPLPPTTIFKEIHVDPAALYDQLTEGNLVESDMVEKRSGLGMMPGALYGPGGTRYEIRPAALDVNGKIGAYPYLYWATDGCADYLRIKLEYDEEAYEQAGLAVLQAINDAGIDITRHAGGNPWYGSNEEALRDRYPQLFSPCIYVTAHEAYADSNYGTDTAATYGPAWWQPIENGKLVPIPGFDKIHPENVYSYEGVPGNNKFVCTSPVIALPYYSSPRGSYVLRNLATENNKLFFDVDYPEVAVVYAKAYKRDILSGMRVKIQPTGTAKSYIMATYGNRTNIGVSRWSYVDALDREAILDGYLELRAMFGKVDRSGKLQALRLNTENPVALQPERYSQLWWDEYDVEPIGTILYSFENEEDGESEQEYNFGSGASIYDMTDNALLKNLVEPSAESVQALLDEHFIPHLLPVAFTPIELTMQGLPYLEDGDYLTAVANDGTVARSFNMRHELSGIQILEADVTSVSGQIIGSESEVFG